MSLLLDKKITEIRSMRNISSLIEDNQALMILDIVIKLDDGSLVNGKYKSMAMIFQDRGQHVILLTWMPG